MSVASLERPARTGWLDYRTIWRWHFYAGLFCVPFIIILSITGMLYLFKPQVEAWIDRPYDRLALAGPAADADAQALAAVAAVPDGRLQSYILPEPGKAVRVLVRDKGGTLWRVYVHPENLTILHKVAEEDRLMQQIKRIHGELLMGDGGSLLVELAACWGIVMVVSGLYLWWPRNGQGWAGTAYPRLRAGGRTFWRDIHAVVGFWISLLALFLLLTGLPWATVWGAGFKMAREATGTSAGRQDWTTSRAAEKVADAAENTAATGHAHAHDPAMMLAGAVGLTEVAAKAASLHIAAPVLINPPKAIDATWAVRGMSQNRPERVSVDLDGMTGEIVYRQDFADRHIIDRAVGIGVAAHEGQLFGPFNQALGVAAALGLVLLSVSGAVMWWKRRPTGALGAPPVLRFRGNAALMAGLLLVFALLLPVLGASLVIVVLLDLLVLRHLTDARRWLGLKRVS
jgi:uncharacterized iron-regulated membrane protein